MTRAIGLMSGTSCDGISAAVVAFDRRSYQLLAFRTYPYPRSFSVVLQRARELTVPAAAQLNIVLGELLARAALTLLRTKRLSPHSIAVIGSHGHTVYHGPTDAVPCTLQLGEPAVIAQRTGIPVVADFRMRDLAAGGQGAPLVPLFDQHLFGRGAPRALQNLGGIANVTIVGRQIAPLAFDTGPGNCLIDAVARRISRGTLRYDPSGRLAARGRIDHTAVKRLWAHPYFRTAPPKSTGPEVFGESLITKALGTRWQKRPHDALATVTYFTAYSIVESYRRFVPIKIHEMIVSGGGTSNRTLMTHLAHLLHPVPIRPIDDYGLPSQAKEPVAFAYLALRALRGQINHLPTTTGAREAHILGVIAPA